MSTAHSYQFEVKGQYGESIDEPRGYEAQQSQASLVWWLDNVSTNKGPLAEAGFLSRTSSLSVSYGRVETEIEPPPDFIAFFGSPQETESERYGAAFSWVHESGWILRAQGGRTDTDQSPGNLGDRDGDEYGIGVGYYLTDSTTIDANFLRGESDGGVTTRRECPPILISLLGVCIESISTQFDTEVDTTSLGIKHVGNLLNQDFAVSFQYARIELDTTTRGAIVTRDAIGNLQTFRSRSSIDTSTDAINAEITWYPTRQLGFEFGISRQDLDDGADVDSYRIGTSWFVTQNLYLGASIERTEVVLLTGEDDLDSATLKVGLRW